MLVADQLAERDAQRLGGLDDRQIGDFIFQRLAGQHLLHNHAALHEGELPDRGRLRGRHRGIGAVEHHAAGLALECRVDRRIAVGDRDNVMPDMAANALEIELFR